MGDFKPGDRVRCITGEWPLHVGAIYTIGERVDLSPGTHPAYALAGYAPGFLWGGYRFELVEAAPDA